MFFARNTSVTFVLFSLVSHVGHEVGSRDHFCIRAFGGSRSSRVHLVIWSSLMPRCRLLLLGPGRRARATRRGASRCAHCAARRRRESAIFIPAPSGPEGGPWVPAGFDVM